MASPTDEQIKLARAFAQLVCDSAGADLPEVNRRNREEERMDCASNDFVRADALMNRAWQATISGALPKRRGKRNREEAELWNGAWKLAAAAGFDVDRIK